MRNKQEEHSCESADIPFPPDASSIGEPLPPQALYTSSIPLGIDVEDLVAIIKGYFKPEHLNKL